MPTNEFFYGEICRWGKSSFSHAVDVEGAKEKKCLFIYSLPDQLPTKPFFIGIIRFRGKKRKYRQ
jgi:hypothetical protein